MAYPLEARLKVIELHKQGKTRAAIQKVMEPMKAKTIDRIIKAHRDGTTMTKKVRKARMTPYERVGKHLSAIVLKFEEEKQPCTVASVNEKLKVASGEVLSDECVRGYLHRLGFSFKGGEKRWDESSPVRCSEYWAYYTQYIRPYHIMDDLVFLDEASFDPHDVHSKTWLPKGKHVVTTSGKTYGRRVSVCALLGTEGVIKRAFTYGTYKGDSYMRVLHTFLAHIAGQNKVMVIDNARSHLTTKPEIYERLTWCAIYLLARILPPSQPH